MIVDSSANYPAICFGVIGTSHEFKSHAIHCSNARPNASLLKKVLKRLRSFDIYAIKIYGVQCNETTVALVNMFPHTSQELAG